MKSNVVKDKSFAFAVRIIKLYQHQIQEHKEYIISKQLLRSGTAVGALVRESVNAESRADFVHKLGIAQKECDETIYWLELIYATNYISLEEFQSLNADATELLKIIRSIILSTKSNAKK